MLEKDDTWCLGLMSLEWQSANFVGRAKVPDVHFVAIPNFVWHNGANAHVEAETMFHFLYFYSLQWLYFVFIDLIFCIFATAGPSRCIFQLKLYFVLLCLIFVSVNIWILQYLIFVYLMFAVCCKFCLTSDSSSRCNFDDCFVRKYLLLPSQFAFADDDDNDDEEEDEDEDEESKQIWMILQSSILNDKSSKSSYMGAIKSHRIKVEWYMGPQLCIDHWLKATEFHGGEDQGGDAWLQFWLQTETAADRLLGNDKLFVFFLFVCLSVCQFVCLSVCLFLTVEIRRNYAKPVVHGYSWGVYWPTLFTVALRKVHNWF